MVSIAMKNKKDSKDVRNNLSISLLFRSMSSMFEKTLVKYAI